jgi:hypothetical protein
MRFLQPEQGDHVKGLSAGLAVAERGETASSSWQAGSARRQQQDTSHWCLTPAGPFASELRLSQPPPARGLPTNLHRSSLEHLGLPEGVHNCD